MNVNNNADIHFPYTVLTASCWWRYQSIIGGWYDSSVIFVRSCLL